MAKQYIEPQKRYEDHRSTGFLFLSLGLIGAAATILCWLDIIKIPLNTFQLTVLLAMFASAIIFGIWSFKKASKVAATITSENAHVADMRKWIAEHCKDFCSENAENLADNEIYFQWEQEIRDAISEKFPDIEESLLDTLVEETYQKLFES